MFVKTIQLYLMPLKWMILKKINSHCHLWFFVCIKHQEDWNLNSNSFWMWRNTFCWRFFIRNLKARELREKRRTFAGNKLQSMCVLEANQLWTQKFCAYRGWPWNMLSRFILHTHDWNICIRFIGTRLYTYELRRKLWQRTEIKIIMPWNYIRRMKDYLLWFRNCQRKNVNVPRRR